MAKRSVKPLIVFAVLVSMAVTTVPLRAECIAGPPIANRKRTADRVFEATVTSIKALEHGENVATLDVHRVWKGDTRRETTVYFMTSSVGPFLKDGNRYIFFAKLANPTARKAYEFPPDHPQRSIWVPGCYGLIGPADSVVKQLGRSRKPSDGQMF